MFNVDLKLDKGGVQATNYILGFVQTINSIPQPNKVFGILASTR